MNRAILKSAAAWYAQLGSDDVTDADRHAWQAWRSAHPDHERAWQKIEQLQQQMQGHRRALPKDIVAVTSRLTAAQQSTQRRTVLKTLVSIFVGGTALWTTWRYKTDHFADYATAVGERRTVALDDGSTLVLNTNTAVNIVFSETGRSVRLLHGEILIQTAPDRQRVSGRPFVVQTDDGSILALGTRFTVRRTTSQSQVAVLEKAVEIRPGKLSDSRIVHAGERIEFTTSDMHAVERIAGEPSAWQDGMLVVANWRLEDLLAELDRYRSGSLSCTDEVANLRISGSFPVGNTDLALKAIAKALPVAVVSRTQYWVTVTSAN